MIGRLYVFIKGILAIVLLIGLLQCLGCNKKESQKTKLTGKEILDQLEKLEKEAEKLPIKMKTTAGDREVEIAPNKWLLVHHETTDYDEKADWATHSIPRPKGGPGDDGYDLMKFHWENQEAIWEGAPIPFTLREWQGNLYVIAFDRTDLKKCKFRYYRQKGKRFIEIQPSEFPKRIATQNLGFNDSTQDDRNFKLTLSLDVDNIWFDVTKTAMIWSHIARSKDYYQEKDEADIKALKEYKIKFDPIPLPTIKKKQANADTDQKSSGKSTAVDSGEPNKK